MENQFNSDNLENLSIISVKFPDKESFYFACSKYVAFPTLNKHAS